MADRIFGWHTVFDDAGDSRTPYMTRIWIGRLRLHIFHRGDNDLDCHDHPWDFWTFPLTSYVEEVAEWDQVAPNTMRGTFRLRRQVVRALRFSYRPATHCHRVLGRFSGWWETPRLGLPISDEFVGTHGEHHPYFKGFAPQIEDRRIITIVWRGKGGRKWGFLKNRDDRWCWTPWKEYVFGGGKHAPCEPPSPQPRVEPLFWYRPVGEDGGYEGPHHAQSELGKLFRSQKPEQWKPLYPLPPSHDLDPALIGIAEVMQESGGGWRPCSGCYDTEDGRPTRQYDHSPSLQTDIGLGCHECGGLGATWEYYSEQDIADLLADEASLAAEPGAEGGGK